MCVEGRSVQVCEGEGGGCKYVREREEGVCRGEEGARMRETGRSVCRGRRVHVCEGWEREKGGVGVCERRR